MADAARIGTLAEQTASMARRHGAANDRALSFRDLLDRNFAAQAGTAYLRPGHPHAHIQQAAARAPAPLKLHPAASTATADMALTQAMALEQVPASWQPSLHFIMSHESSGVVGARNPVHSARGLFQLTAANYHLNPHGAASFGNAVEEAQGGIRYIRQRYGTADKALAHWQQHHWY